MKLIKFSCSKIRFLFLLLPVIFLVACSEDKATQNNGFTPPDTAVSQRNKAVGLMGRYEYAAAHDIFAELAKQYPDWITMRVNLAIATLNRQQDGDEQAALEILKQVLIEQPENLPAHYVAGLLELYKGQHQQAQSHFKFVADRDKSDAYAAYYLAQTLAQQGNDEQALTGYRHAIATDPYLRSAYYGLFQALRRLKRVDEARLAMMDYQKMADNPRARLAEFKYTRMGPKAEVQGDKNTIRNTPKIPNGTLFLPPVSIFADQHAPVKNGQANITTADINADGFLDLFLTQKDNDKNTVLFGDANGQFTLAENHPLTAISHVNSALWGDIDNDGLIDVYLTRQGKNQLWRQRADSQWENISSSAQAEGGDLNTIDAVLFDADHDGDLDIFLVNANGANELLNNNLDGTFRPLAAEQGLIGQGELAKQVIPVDLDADRDLDIVVINERQPHEIYYNDRLWQYQPATNWQAFRETPALAAVAADIDADGQIEIYTIDDQRRLLRWQADQAFDVLAKLEGDGADWITLQISDINGDGQAEMIVAEPQAWSVYQWQPDQPVTRIFQQTGKFQGWLSVAIQPAKGLAIITLQTEGLTLNLPGPGRFPFLALNLSGQEDQAHAMRSNASGLGTLVTVQTGNNWTRLLRLRDHSGPGQSLQPMTIGLGGASRADYIALDWSDGVFQTELALEAGQLHNVTETQRQLASCPVLFAWDGERYAFVSDILGVGGIGFELGRGEYGQPRPWENFLLPEDLLQPRSGRYILKIGEPMEEVAYIDHAQLVAYDLPPGWQMVLDERMGISDPQPTGKPVFFQQEILPIKAMNDRGQDITELLISTDFRAAPVGELDRRFIGRLSRQHSIELTLAQPLEGQASWGLMADGWVEYPYSQTMFAAWQAGAGYRAPSIEAQDEAGQWQTVLHQFGYPAGMPRRMFVPLDKLPAGTKKLRIHSNMEIYWDRLAVIRIDNLNDANKTSLSLTQAKVTKTGFAKRKNHLQRRPDYDYQQRAPFWDAKYMAGHYTRFGTVTPLLAEHDDAVAIIGAGEEVHFEFAATLPALPSGWQRQFVLESRGWAKDMDMYTRDGETVAPIPESGKANQHSVQLNTQFNTRYQAGR